MLNILPLRQTGGRSNNPLLPDISPPTPVSRASAPLYGPLANSQVALLDDSTAPASDGHAVNLSTAKEPTDLAQVSLPLSGNQDPVSFKRSRPSQEDSVSAIAADRIVSEADERAKRRVKVEQQETNVALSRAERFSAPRHTNDAHHSKLDNSVSEVTPLPAVIASISKALKHATNPINASATASTSKSVGKSPATPSPASDKPIKEERRSSLPFNQRGSNSGTPCMSACLLHRSIS